MKKLDKIIKNLGKLEGTHEFSLSEILSDKFIVENTKFSSFDDLVEQSGLEFNVETYEELYNNKELNEFISLNTKFNSLFGMVEVASTEFMKNEILEK
ncbi:hypothetical protein PXD04_11350 (plasmid) [Methanosphaera sp. ISO3-F5]|uniref:hypothetical protein n=1 Tax=Methanosphaera sp. ISO3-F5 TaxID=1452353 RepID=UPI002B25EE66|nr:hypothetical protein [Methanosphaera sp. ISO3-F5]WQH65338.1 hypothetical protein PXD04_11350 [Methanosphaera sp. ISO3-F5]